MPNNIFYARGFSLTIGKRSGKRQIRTCTDKIAVMSQKANETGLFFTRQPTDEARFQRLLEALLCVKIAGARAEDIVDNFSAGGLSKALWSPSEGR